MPPAGTPAAQQLTGSRSPTWEAHLRPRLKAILEGRKIVTAFQPIRDFASGNVVGAGALTRFPGADDTSPGEWFVDAKQARLAGDLEVAALESALAAAKELPGHLYVRFKLSPETCMDPLLPVLLTESAVEPGRTVLELTEPPTKEQVGPLLSVLAPLRRRGVRLAIDHAGSSFTSIRQIRRLQPDFVGLDRSLIAGIDADVLRSSLGEAMVRFAKQSGAEVIAQGIETAEELATVTGLGISAGQGYFLGRPTTRPSDWKQWNPSENKPAANGKQ
ncbi:EAL domain-containing protein [Arthrobacter silvisoli]|uniref:EAL domain-containing protein n=1 Tax=Arthrobacter silvisoli TaxID=2291022 RepID=UPI001FE57912|nr:EAL domain-containing protein [Arthrobacter silvisoli]